MKKIFPLLASFAILAGCAAVGAHKAQPERLIASVYNSGFAESHDSYNAISAGSDGRIYYVLSSESLDTGGQMYSFDPATRKIEHLADLTEACGEKGLKAIPQGKSHVRFLESNGKLYFATHVGYYTIRDGMETMGVPPPGYRAYPGGHLLAYDMAARRIENLATAPDHEGILVLSMDAARQRLYFITWPSGRFVRYDLRTKEMKDFGSQSDGGERGKGPHYQTICRSIAVDPDDGSAYFTNARGVIFRYRPGDDSVHAVEGGDMVKDYFGQYDPSSPGTMGYNWRQTVWDPQDHAVYGVHGNSGYLFRFDPPDERLEVLDRITSEPSRRSGAFDQFSYGYLGFILGPDGHTLYYLTGAPVYRNGTRVAGKRTTAKGEAKGIEDLHLVTYDIANSAYRDNGAVFFANGDRPTYVNSIAVGKDGTVYALSRVSSTEQSLTDLISFNGPYKK
ncbi:MAG: hypothetical protein ABI165_17450 [Bryobacteraceae bacterium]